VKRKREKKGRKKSGDCGLRTSERGKGAKCAMCLTPSTINRYAEKRGGRREEREAAHKFRSLEKKGKEKRADDDFLAFPSRLATLPEDRRKEKRQKKV